MTEQVDLRGEDPDFDHNEDRYPDLQGLLPKVFEEPDYPTGPVEKIEITGLASGHATYRVWEARAEEPIGGVLMPDETS